MGSAIHPIGAFIQGPNPIQDIINGMVQGVDLHNQIQRAQDEHAAMQRGAIETDRNNRIQDITQKMLLGANSRPVNPDGTVTEQMPDSMPGTVGLAGQTFTRKADKSRLVSYKDQDGNSMQRELLTPEEQISKQVRNAQAMAQVGKVPVDLSQTVMGHMIGAQPGTQFVNPTELPGLYTSAVENQPFDLPQPVKDALGIQQSVPARYAAPMITSGSRIITNKNTQEREDQRAADNRTAAGNRADAANSARLQAAGIREGAINGRTDQREAQKTQQQLASAELKKSTGLVQSERAYQTELNRINLTPKSKLDDDARQKAVADAAAALRTAKQNTQNAYEGERAQLGQQTDHVEFAPVAPGASGPGRGTATQGQPQPAGAQFTIGQVVKLKAGKTGKIKKVYPDGTFDLE
ncbi:MAG TPA: hypothetical protein VHZ74_10820 [Bryobacteraceae bacterium]|jgi:hypothetical protein|nr:hypothetical protein [Bryobacteraceae bacterium]